MWVLGCAAPNPAPALARVRVHSRQRFSFKCHRRKIAEVEHVYPVNAIAVHPVYSTFATGGCDGYVCTWDPDKRRRVWQFHQFPASVAALSFNHDGSMLAIASSYTFEMGDQPR